MGSFKGVLVSLLLLAVVDSVICRDAPSSPEKVFTPFFDAEGNPAHGPPVAALQVSDGTVVDCVPIEQQISAHLPSLKGRPVQPKTELPPDHQPLSDATPCQQLFQQEHGACPEGTVAVARPPKQGSWSSLAHHRRQLAATSNTSSDGTVSVQYAPDIIIDNGFAAVDFGWDGFGTDFGGMGVTMSLQQPHVEATTSGVGSGARIMYNIAYWPPGATSSADIGGSSFISAGFTVNPVLGDNVPRFYTFWGLTVPYSKDVKGNCFNMECPGYTHVSSIIALGGPMTGTEISLFIQLEQTTQRYNLLSGTHLVGFWDFAETLGWRLNYFVQELKMSATAAVFSGGLVSPIVTAGRVTTTHMGTGKYPYEGGAAYIRNIVWQSNVDRLYYQVPHAGELSKTLSVPRVCYDAYVGSSVEWGTYFLYGGRGGENPACHV